MSLSRDERRRIVGLPPERASVPTARRWRVRRATLVDVPAAARLLRPPEVDWPSLRAANAAHSTADPTGLGASAGPGLTQAAIPTATRLVLAHVGLESGEFWVAETIERRLIGAVVLLPGARDSDQEGLRLALQLELGLLALPDPADFVDGLDGHGPAVHWLMLSGMLGPDRRVMTALLAAALPAVDSVGLPVISLPPGPLTDELRQAGFVAVRSGRRSGTPPLEGAVRPGARSPVGA